ncbi:MAG: hypothetical protein Q4G52_12365 [Clostridia bacterium]|nr:hypothetical protein [Clostridia bacterium]
MHRILMIESAARGVLTVNGQFCGPLEGEGQAFPAAENAEVYIQLSPFSPQTRPLTVAMELEGGAIKRLEPQENAFALLWPDGIIQLELRPVGEGTAEGEQAAQEQAASGALLRYLTLRLAGQGDAARLLLMRPQDEVNLPEYDAVVPLRFAPLAASERFDDRAGLVRREAPNVARVYAALAVTAPAGQGRRLIERVEVMA